MQTLSSPARQAESRAATQSEGKGAPGGQIVQGWDIANQLAESPRQAAQRALIQRVKGDEEELLQGCFQLVTGRMDRVQRKVDPTTKVNGVPVNDDSALEHEADAMGAQAAQFVPSADAGLDAGASEPQGNARPGGLPGPLKAGIEHLSGLSMDSVRVHSNSGMPAQLNALAYAQGTDIHLGPGQEQHLPHEAWHVVQQASGSPLAGSSSVQLKNSKTPNWYQEYLKFPGIHDRNVQNYITHVEQGVGGAGNQQGIHAMPGGHVPANIEVVEQSSVGYDHVGKILWYNTNQPGASGQSGQPIRVKNSTIFPTRLSVPFHGVTCVRALMKASAAGQGFAEISRGAGLDGLVEDHPPTVYPKGSPLRESGTDFQVGNKHYRVIGTADSHQ